LLAFIEVDVLTWPTACCIVELSMKKPPKYIYLSGFCYSNNGFIFQITFEEKRSIIG